MSKKLSKIYADEVGTTVRLRRRKGRVYVDVLIADEKQMAEGFVWYSRQEITGCIAICKAALAYRKAKKAK